MLEVWGCTGVVFLCYISGRVGVIVESWGRELCISKFGGELQLKFWSEWELNEILIRQVEYKIGIGARKAKDGKQSRCWATSNMREDATEMGEGISNWKKKESVGTYQSVSRVKEWWVNGLRILTKENEGRAEQAREIRRVKDDSTSYSEKEE